MKVKNLFLGLLFAFSISTVATAATPFGGGGAEADSKAFKEISNIVQHIDFDLSTFDAEKVKVYFMLNELNEIIVLRTDNTEVDRKIKNNLNYKSVKNRDLKVNQLYVLPITFERR